MRGRLIILIGMIVIFLGVVGAGLYVFTNKNKQASEPVQKQDEVSPTPEPEQPVLRLVVDEAVISAIPSFNGERLWYMTADGKLFRKDLAAATSTSQEFPLPAKIENPLSIIWQEKASDFVVQYLSSGHSRYAHYDATANTLTDYPEAMRSVALLSDDKTIIYDWVSAAPKKPIKHELKTSDLSSQSFRKLTDLFRPDYEIVSSPRKNEIAVFGENIAEPGNLMLVDLETVSFEDIGPKDVYLGAKFSPDGSRILFARAVASSTPELAVYDTVSGATVKLAASAEIWQTLWAKNSNEILVWKSGKLTSHDVAAKTAKILYEQKSGAIAAVKNLFWHPFNNTIYFTDEEEGLLYELDLN